MLRGRIPLSQQPRHPLTANGKGDRVIIEFHLTWLEDKEIGDHLKRCHTAFCENVAHLFAALVEDYAEVATVRTFVDGSKRRHQRKPLGRAGSDDAAAEADKPASLAIIRQAWDRLDARDHEERLSKDQAQPIG